MAIRKNVLFLPSWYPNRTAPSLGNFIQRHATAVAEFHNVTVLYAVADPSLHDEFEMEVAEHNGVNEVIIYYKQVTNEFPFISSFLKYRRFMQACRKGYRQVESLFGKPDILHVHVIWRAALFALELKEQLKIPMVISEHWSGYMPEDGSFSGKMMKRTTERAVRQAEAVIAVSEKMKQAMKSHGLENKYHIIPNVVDTELFRPAERQNDVKTRMIHVSTVNDREKNISGMLRVIKKLSETRQDFILEIIGDSPEREGFQRMAKELAIEKYVEFTGYRPIEEVAAHVRNANFFVMFSNYEGLPCVILEALSSGLPVVASRTGGIPQVIDKDSGILVEVQDENGLLDALSRMLADYKKYDKEALRKYAVDNFSYHHVGEQIAVIYNKVI